MSASAGDGGAGTALAQRGRLLRDVNACISDWKAAFARGASPQDPTVGRLSTTATELGARARGVGFGGIAFHFGELLRHLHTPGGIAEAQASLDVVSHLAEQGWRELSPAELAALAPAQSAAPPAFSERSGERANDAGLAPPRMITVLNANEQRASARTDGPASPALTPPPRLDRSPPIEALPHAALAPAPVAPPPAPAEPARSGAWEVSPVSRRDPLGPARTEGPTNARSGAPNLGVRTMLGLRAFAKRGTSQQPAAPSAPAPEAAAEAAGQPALLNLKRVGTGAVSTSAQPNDEPRPPMRLDRPLSGLPPLPAPIPAVSSSSGPDPAQRSHSTSRMQQLLGDLRRGRPAAQRTKGSRLARRREGEPGWKLGLLVGIGLFVVLGGMVTTIVVVSRNRVDANGTAASASAAASAAGASVPALPDVRLSTDSDRLRSLLAQVHGRGKESAELRALVDEHAALAAKVIGSKKCEGSQLVCMQAAKVRESVLGDTSGRRVFKKRPPPSPDRLRSAWLVGLKLPEIAVEDDPRVRRRFEFYTENPVGRETFQSMLFRCGAYRDLIQATLIRYGLPADLLAVVFVESGCEPQATSPVGAAGLWQFMPAAARAYHLRVIEDTVDERRSPPKSTEAGIRYLRDLYEKLGNWDLAFAAYNMGPFGLMARLEQAGGGDIGFWDLVDAEMLPDDTADYAPAIQAIALILNNLQRLKFAGIQMRAPQLTSDLEVPPGTRLGLIARAASISVTQVHSLNLDISGEQTPNVANFAVQVPKDVVFQARDTLRDLLAHHDDMDRCVPPTFDWGRQRFTPQMADACRHHLAQPPP